MKHCKKCREEHWGKCLKEHVAERRERLTAEEEKLKKQLGALKKMEESAVRAASAVPAWESDNDSNKSMSDYTCVLWGPMQPTLTPVLTCTAAFSCAAINEACMDSCSQVSITGNAQHILSYEEGEINVCGVHCKAL